MSIGQRRWMAGFWTLAAVAQIALPMVAYAEESANIVFHDDYNKALREAKLTQKPIFLEFRCAP